MLCLASTLCAIEGTEPTGGGIAPAEATPPATPLMTPPATVKRPDRTTARSRLLATKTPDFKLITFQGDEYALVKPTVGKRGDIYNTAMGAVSAVTKSAKFDSTLLHLNAIVACLYTVVDGKPDAPVFEDADKAELLNQPAGADSIVAVLGDVAFGFLNQDEASAKNG
jgi:hypothetical protein